MTRKRHNHITVHLQDDESEVIRRIVGHLPAGLVSVNRIARACIMAGAPIVEADFAERSKRLVDAGIDPAAVKP